MKLMRPVRPRTDIGLTPMINVVFLLLIFFLMAAELAPPVPFDITAPNAVDDPAFEPGDRLYIGADGRLGFNGERGEDLVLRAVVRWHATCETCSLDVMADQEAYAAQLVRLMARLRALGIDQVTLITRRVAERM